ncbi:MAG: CdaR family protein [Candidatus Brocadiales bacterium]
MYKKFILGNIRVKLMALAIAITLWLYAVGRHTGELEEDIPLAISTPPGFTMLIKYTDTVTIKVRGPQNTISNFSSLIKNKKIQATYRIAPYKKDVGDHVKETILLGKDNLNLPEDVRLVSITPSKIEVTLGKLQRKYLKVRLKKEGEPAPGYKITSESVYPLKVIVTGTASAMMRTLEIDTIPINVNGITADQNKTFPWRIPIEQRITFTQDGKKTSVPVTCKKMVQVWFSISPQVDLKKFEKIRIKVLQPPEFPYKVKLQDQFIDLQVKGPKLILDKLQLSDIGAYVDVDSLKPPGPYKLPILCTFPNGVELSEELPEVNLDILERKANTN